jgi:radical SAM protein with 4Fe4S-binding SPASM domain
MSFFSDLLISGKLRLNTWNINSLRQSHPLNYLFWECTLNCNFNCQHCGSNAGRKNHFTNELTTVEIKKVFKSIAKQTDATKIMVAITGGEPLLRSDLFEVMTFANKLGFKWGMVTNGSLVTPTIISKMEKSGMNTIVVSIDGIGSVHEEFRQTPGSYQKAINAIKLLTKSKVFKDVQITTTVHPKNISNLEKMYQEFVSLGITSWRLINVDPIGRAEDNKNILLNPSQLKKLLNFIQQKRSISSIDISYGCTGFLGPKYEGKVRSWLFYCSAGITTGSILHNGDIFVCPNVPRQSNLIQGNVRHDDFYTVWKNKFSFFRDSNRTSCTNCQKCNYWTECKGGSLHLWDFYKKQPKFCHFDYLK